MLTLWSKLRQGRIIGVSACRYFTQERRNMGKPTQPVVNFVQKFNPTKNSFEWVEQPEQYDFYQEIARSAYADMLHDFDRNLKYERALAKAIVKIKSTGAEAAVLDIGTGTGLLSMMAVRHGADRVYACEAFQPMAKCAAEVISRNDCAGKIKLIHKRSTELEVGPGKDLDSRANILVTEVFDTELIGEGAIETFNHAHEFLLQPGSQVIPHSAEIHALVVECPTVEKWNVLQPMNLPNNSKIHFPESISRCSGVPSVHDLQLSELKPNLFKTLSSLQKIFDFDYTEHQKRTEDYSYSALNFQSTGSGKCNAIFTWWLLNMDQEKEIVITMQPEWWDAKDPKLVPTWKDHWMQCVYYLPSPVSVTQGENLALEAFHDEFSFWYKISRDKVINSIVNQDVPRLERPICDCGVHVSLSRFRIGMLNDDKRNKQYIEVLQKHIIPGESVCLVISEGSLLPLIAASLGAKKVFVLEEHLHSVRVAKEFIYFNKLEDIVEVIHKTPEKVTSEDLNCLKVDVVLGDPYFHSAILPWNNFYFWYVKESLNWCFAKTVKIIPKAAYLKGVAVSFQDLHHIKFPVNTVKSFEPSNSGYDLQDFDNLVLRASDLTDHRFDVQPLWEYKGKRVSEDMHLAKIDLTKQQFGASHDPVQFQKFHARPNGIVLWIDWELDEGNVINNGPLNGDMENDTLLQWDMNSKQGVFFTGSADLLDTMCFSVNFIAESGDVSIRVASEVQLNAKE